MQSYAFYFYAIQAVYVITWVVYENNYIMFWGL